MEQILETMEDIKQNIKDDEYKKIMDGLQILYYKPEYKGKVTETETQKYLDLINWLDEHISYEYDRQNGAGFIKKKDLINYIITNYYNDVYYKNINFVKRALSIHLANVRNTRHYYYGIYSRDLSFSYYA